MSKIFVGKVRKDYFLYALLVFLASYFILPTAKMVNNVFYALVALPALVFIIKSRFADFNFNFIVSLWFVFLAGLIVSGLLSGESLQYYKHILYVFVFLATCVFLVKGQYVFNDTFYRISFWVVTLYVLLSAVVYWLTGKYGFGERVIWLPARMSGPIYTSMLISALFSITLPVWIQKKKYLEIFVAFSLALFIMSFILQSRTGIVALLFVSFVYFSYKIYMSRGLKYVFLFSVSVFLILGLFYYFSDSIPILGGLVKREDAGRFELWSQLLKDFQGCNQWFGCGPAFESDRLIKGSYPIVHAHNIYLALLLHTGIISLLLFLLICSTALYLSYVNKNYWGLYLLSSLVALNFDGSHLIGNPDELWILILLPLFMIMLKSNKYKNISSQEASL